MNKKTILIKISGASLKKGNSIFDFEQMNDLTRQIKEIKKQYKIAIVIGGGNIFRGNVAKEFKMERSDADYMGMLATIMNGIMLQNVLEHNDVKSKIYSALEVYSVCEPYTIRKALAALEDDYVCLFVAGTGSPYVTTDTGAALRACQIKADMILMGKNGVDGVYCSDPKTNQNAKRYDYLTYHDVIANKLEVMDLSALSLCEEHDIDILVFNIDSKNALVDVLNDRIHATVISNKDK